MTRLIDLVHLWQLIEMDPIMELAAVLKHKMRMHQLKILISSGLRLSKTLILVEISYKSSKTKLGRENMSEEVTTLRNLNRIKIIWMLMGCLWIPNNTINKVDQTAKWTVALIKILEN